jgi:hypothetical protein
MWVHNYIWPSISDFHVSQLIESITLTLLRLKSGRSSSVGVHFVMVMDGPLHTNKAVGCHDDHVGPSSEWSMINDGQSSRADNPTSLTLCGCPPCYTSSWRPTPFFVWCEPSMTITRWTPALDNLPGLSLGDVRVIDSNSISWLTWKSDIECHV